MGAHRFYLWSPRSRSLLRRRGRSGGRQRGVLNGAVAVKEEGLWGSQARLLVGWGARASGRRALLGVVGLRGHPVRPPLSASSLVLLFFFLLSGGRPSLLSGVAAARRVLRAPLVGSRLAFLVFPTRTFFMFCSADRARFRRHSPGWLARFGGAVMVMSAAAGLPLLRADGTHAHAARLFAPLPHSRVL